MNRKLGIMAECICEEDAVITLERIKRAGFECFFSEGYDAPTVEGLSNAAKKLGLEYEFIHAPFSGINDMWLEGDGYKTILNGMLEAIKSANLYDIKGVVLHISSGWNPPEICDEGLKRFDEIVATAKDLNVTVAFENIRMVGNVAYFYDRYYNNEFVKYCYDCGHEHCYTETVCFPDIFRNQMIYTHLHDNMGRSKTNPLENGDLHLLPFDGDIDFKTVMHKLNEYDFKGSLMLEVNNRDYKDLSPDKFIDLAYERVKKLSSM